jgi:hypothetical protein
MRGPSRKQLEDALNILGRYQSGMVRRMAEDIIEHREEFESTYVCGAEEIIDKYYHLIQSMCPIVSILQAYDKRMGPPAERERVVEKILEKHQFRCFSCRNIISDNSDACPYCGWKWK